MSHGNLSNLNSIKYPRHSIIYEESTSIFMHHNETGTLSSKEGEYDEAIGEDKINHNNDRYNDLDNEI